MALTPKISTLIDRPDAYEVIGQQIVCILAVELAEQQRLAGLANKSAGLWCARVYHERSNPWTDFAERDEDRGPRDRVAPIVNVTFDSDSTQLGASNTVERQRVSAVYHIDCLGFGESADGPGSGHIPGDARAAMEAQRAARLARSILMADSYTYLGLQGTVARRGISSREQMVPTFDGQSVQHVVAVRMQLQVEFNEFSPQYVPVVLEQINATITRAEDGRVLLSAQF